MVLFKPGNRRFLVRALSLCGEAFSIKTELVTVATCGDIGEAATDAEGVSTVPRRVTAVQMVNVTGGVRIGELVATVRRRRTLKSGPGGREWWWRGGVGRRTMRRQRSWRRSMCGIINNQNRW